MSHTCRKSALADALRCEAAAFPDQGVKHNNTVIRTMMTILTMMTMLLDNKSIDMTRENKSIDNKLKTAILSSILLLSSISSALLENKCIDITK